MSKRYIPMLVRGYPEKREPYFARKEPPEISLVMADDMETFPDTHALMFGCAIIYQVARFDGKTSITPVSVYLYHADNLEKTRPHTYLSLISYAKTHDGITLLNHRQFMRDVFVPTAFNPEAVITGFNYSYDMWGHLSHTVEARGKKFAGGMSGVIDGTILRYREKTAGMGMMRELTAYKGNKKIPTAQIVDSSQLSRALTGNKHSLRTAGEAAGCEILKYNGAEVHDPEKNYKGRNLTAYLEHYISYCINDVKAVADLWRVLTERMSKHPVNLRQSQAFSSASFSKAYLRVLNIHGMLCTCKECVSGNTGAWGISPEYIGKGQAAFYGGRADCFIRLTETPGVILDFTSEYPTAMILEELWELIIAKRIIIDDVTEEIREFLKTVENDDLYESETWKRMTVFCDLEAKDYLLPFRGKYEINKVQNIGVNYATTPGKEVTWSLHDVVAHKIRTGKTPEIARAWRLSPYRNSSGRIVFRKGMRTIDFNGDPKLRFDPYKDNLFKFIIEQKQVARKDHTSNGSASGWKEDPNACLCDACDRGNFLKVLANAIFGIFAEMNLPKRAKDKPEHGTIWGLEADSWDIKNPEVGGEFCFPPFASLITSGGRLLLAMLQSEVNGLGTEIIFCDTDSGCIPASPGGGEFNGVKLITYDQVEKIRKKFNGLNPYDPTLVKDILKTEWPKDDFPLPIYILAISSKRYAVYRRSGCRVEFRDGRWVKTGDHIDILKCSAHGLGVYANPLTPDPMIDDQRKPDWLKAAWEWIIRTQVDGEEYEPEWFDLPLVTSLPVRKMHTWHLLKRRARPFSWYQKLTATVSESVPIGLSKSNSDEWLTQEYWDSDTGKKLVPFADNELYEESNNPHKILVNSYRTMMRNYAEHPETKYDGPDGRPCDEWAKGILQPCHVIAAGYVHITKDASSYDVIDEQEEYIRENDGDYRAYADNSRQYLRNLAREFYKAHAIGRVRLASILGITNEQARMFMRNGPQIPAKDVVDTAIDEARIKAWLELNSANDDYDGLTQQQVLSDWHEQYNRGFVDLMPIEPAAPRKRLIILDYQEEVD